MSLQMVPPLETISAHLAGKPPRLDLRGFVSVNIVAVTFKVVLPLEHAAALCAHERVFVGVCPVVTGQLIAALE